MTNWCILRTAPSRTLSLATALSDAGYDAWTPVETFTRCMPRSKAKKQVSRPIMPTIVFAGYERLPELLSISRMPIPSYERWDEGMQCLVTRSVPSFSIFKYMSQFARVPDSQLDALRVAEQVGRPRAAARVLIPGDLVRYAGAGFDGLTGTVYAVKGNYAHVLFGGSHPVKVPSVVLLPAIAAAA
jgi:hypothetical protein